MVINQLISIHFHLSEDNHYYSVPFRYAGMQLTAIYDTDSVEIYDGPEWVAIHQRSPIAEGYTTVIDHMPEKPQSLPFTKGLG